MKETHATISWIRVPVVEERAPMEESLDDLVNALKNEPASTQCIFSCQMGKGRTTLGKKHAIFTKKIKIFISSARGERNSIKSFRKLKKEKKVKISPARDTL